VSPACGLSAGIFLKGKIIDEKKVEDIIKESFILFWKSKG
jgi:hypothetical protein